MKPKKVRSPTSELFRMLNWKISILGLAVLFSALGVVYSKHYTRILHAQAQSLSYQENRVHTEWSQLLVEYSSLTSNAHVEHLAKEKLHMIFPASQEILLIK